MKYITHNLVIKSISLTLMFVLVCITQNANASVHSVDTFTNGSISNQQSMAEISSYTYTYDANSNRKTQTEVNGGAAEDTTYTYDLNDRLETVDYPDATITYGYDDAFNRTSETAVEKLNSTTVVDKTYSYNTLNQLTGITDNLDNANNVTYQYDLNGNLVLKSQNGVNHTYIYDARDQLISARQGATVLGDYGYDYQGLRTSKTDATSTRQYTYDEQSVLLQSDTNGQTLATYRYGPDQLLSLDHSTEGQQYYLFDGLGSVVNLTKPDGSLQARYQYDAWGNTRTQVGQSANPFGFTGHEKDEESSLYYFKARYYDASLGV